MHELRKCNEGKLMNKAGKIDLKVSESKNELGIHKLEKTS